MPSESRVLKGPRDSGTVAVETAVVSSLLITLLFGVVEASFFFKDYITVSSAARAGARMGAAQPRVSTFAQDAANQVTNGVTGLSSANIEEVWVYRTTNATGLPDSGSYANCTTCVKFTWNVGTQRLAPSYSNWAAASQNACDADPLRDSLGLYVKYKHSSPIGFFFKDKIVSESTVMWIEPTVVIPCKP